VRFSSEGEPDGNAFGAVFGRVVVGEGGEERLLLGLRKRSFHMFEEGGGCF